MNTTFWSCRSGNKNTIPRVRRADVAFVLRVEANTELLDDARIIMFGLNYLFDYQ